MLNIIHALAYLEKEASTPAVNILTSQQPLFSKHSLSPDYGRKPSGMFTTSILSRNVFCTMGLKDRSSQKHKTSVHDDDDFRGLSTFSNLHIKKKKETEKVGDGSSKKKLQLFDWDVTLLRSSWQESIHKFKLQKRSMLLPLNNENSPAKKSCSIPVSASPMKPSLFGENIREPLFKQNKTFKQPPMNLPSDDAESENGEDTTPYGGDDNIIGTDEENDLLKDDADENKEADVHGTEDNQTKVDSLLIHFNTSYSGRVVTNTVEDNRKADGQLHAEQLSQLGRQKSPSISTPVKGEHSTKNHDSSSCSCSSNCSTCKSCYTSSGSSAPVFNKNDPEDSEEYSSEDDGNLNSENDDEGIKKQKTAAQKNFTESQQEDIWKQKKDSQKNFTFSQTDVIQKQKKAVQKIFTDVDYEELPKHGDSIKPYVSPQSRDKCIKNYMEKIGASSVQANISSQTARNAQPAAGNFANITGSIGSKPEKTPDSKTTHKTPEKMAGSKPGSSQKEKNPEYDADEKKDSNKQDNKKKSITDKNRNTRRPAVMPVQKQTKRSHHLLILINLTTSMR